jgi:[ribosomal protein S18]-alanine N-acetyltransferase
VEKPEWNKKNRTRGVYPGFRKTPGYNGGVPFLVRDFKPEDFETIWRLDQECFPPGIAYSRQELKLYIQRRGAFTLVAENQNETHHSTEGLVAGFIVAQSGATGHIITIDVAKSARRAGIGSELLTAAEKRLETSNAAAVTLETAVDNTNALAFYKRHGYSVVRVWPRYYANGVDALVLSKDL